MQSTEKTQEEIKIDFDRQTTQILDSHGNHVEYSAHWSERGYVEGYGEVCISAGGKIIGEATYSTEYDGIHIKYMDNSTVKSDNPLRHVGTALFECIFKVSLTKGHEGRVTLKAIEKSPPAYFKMGFRMFSFFYLMRCKAIYEYQKNPSEFNKSAILKSYSYEDIFEENPELQNKPFDEMIELSKFNVTKNNKIEEMINSGNKITCADCYANGFNTYMYLPKEQIEINKIKFLNANIDPIQSLQILPTFDAIIANNKSGVVAPEIGTADPRSTVVPSLLI